MRGGLVLAVVAGCSGTDAECEGKEPECESVLVIEVEEGRTEFLMTVTDTEGMDVQIDCPNEDTGAGLVLEHYVLTCGVGRMTIETNRHFGDEVTVQLGAAPGITFTPDYQRGGDICGNPCNTGTISL